MHAPREEYLRRKAARADEARRWDGVDARIAAGRLAVAVVAVVLGVIAWRSPTVSWGWLAVPVAAFAALAATHGRAIAARERAQRALRYYEDGLARLDGRPSVRGDGGAEHVDDDHPYAADLDLFGPDSLFARIDSTRTRPGARMLASWLLAPAGRDVIVARQAAVAELRDALDLREDLAVLAETVGERADTDRLRHWAESVDAPGPAWLPVAAGVLATLSLGTLVAWGSGAWSVWPFLGAVVVQSLVLLPYRSSIARVLARASGPEHDLGLLSAVLRRFEQERFAAPRLTELRRALEEDGAPPSRRIRALARRVDLADARRNQLFLPLAAVLLWGTQCAFALARWRDRHGPAVGRWLDAVGELEALAALSGWAFEHPDDPFPVLDEAGPARIDAVALGHPLIPAASLVRNDVRLGPEPALLVVSGSNMSGKSTLLRAVGVNVVLALAGAPVHARSMRLVALDVGATLRIQDSLQAGESRFYAEISRLRQILDRAERARESGRPVLFLLDEILAGTNSHDRALGSEAILRGLLDRGAVGLVTTHDLALATIAERLAPRAANVHFEDRLDGDRMVFDYRMRAGVVRRSNALALMRSIGLDV